MNETKRKYSHKLNLQMFAQDPTDPPADPPQDPPVDPPKKLEFTQEEFDATIAKRLGQERKKYADYDDLKAERDRLKADEDKRTKDAMTVQERLQAEKDEAEQKAAEASEARDKALTTANQRIIRTEFRLLAKEAGVRADALDDAYKLADLASATVNDDGDVTGVTEVITALLAAKPYLAEPTKKEPRQVGGPSGGDQRPEKTKEQLLAEAADKARKSGRMEDRVAYAALKDELNR